MPHLPRFLLISSTTQTIKALASRYRAPARPNGYSHSAGPLPRFLLISSTTQAIKALAPRYRAPAKPNGYSHSAGPLPRFLLISVRVQKKKDRHIGASTCACLFLLDAFIAYMSKLPVISSLNT